MGNGLNEWPLMLFTVLGQFVVGGFIVMAYYWMKSGDEVQRERMMRSMFLLWVLMGLAFAASIAHLGSPLRAFNSLSRVGQSGLSNEIAMGALFFALGGLGWLLVQLKKMPVTAGRVWAVVAMLLGLAFIWMMARVYSGIETVPTWFGGYTTLAFFMSVLLGGPLLGLLLFALAGAPLQGRQFALLSAVALVVTMCSLLLQSADLATIHSSVQAAGTLVPDYASLQVVRLLLLLLGLGCWFWPLLRNGSPGALHFLGGFILVLAGELIGRGIFYGLHMTVGMAVTG